MMKMKQECPLLNVWLTWLGVPALGIAVGSIESWWAGVFVLLVGIFAQYLYVKIFPRISQLIGYGSVEDVRTETTQNGHQVSRVVLYTANVCPFCPIVKSRLSEIQKEMGFDLEEIDITFRQDIIKQKGFHSVPIVEADGRYWVGNATSSQLSEFLTPAK